MKKEIVLRSVDHTRNRNRLYTLSMQKGILGTWTVIVRNARYGKHGQQRIYIFDEQDEAEFFIIKKTFEKLRRDYKEEI